MILKSKPKAFDRFNAKSEVFVLIVRNKNDKTIEDAMVLGMYASAYAAQQEVGRHAKDWPDEMEFVIKPIRTFNEWWVA